MTRLAAVVRTVGIDRAAEPVDAPFGWPEFMNAHLRALVARAAALGRTVRPGSAEEQRLARTEGWSSSRRTDGRRRSWSIRSKPWRDSRSSTHASPQARSSTRRSKAHESRHALTATLAALALAGCGGGEERPAAPDRAQLDRRLIAAAFAGDVAAAERLTRAGADVNAKDETQQSAYLIATSEVGDDPRLLELTLANGARVDDKDSYDGTGLIRAAERGHPRIVARLLRAGIDRDHVNRLGWTALHEAIVLGEGGPPHVATVRALVRGGVDVDVPDGDGVRPLAHAEERGLDRIARILRAAGAHR